MGSDNVGVDYSRQDLYDEYGWGVVGIEDHLNDMFIYDENKIGIILADEQEGKEAQVCSWIDLGNCIRLTFTSTEDTPNTDEILELRAQKENKKAVSVFKSFGADWVDPYGEFELYLSDREKVENSDGMIKNIDIFEIRIKNIGDANNDPLNPSKFIDAMRYLGYSNATSLLDLIDNSIDSGADLIKLDIKQDGKSFIFRISDNGSGMSRIQLEEALKLGSRSNRDRSKDLGFFGMGLITAGIGLAKKILVMTKKKNASIYLGKFDVEEIERKNEFTNMVTEENDIDLSFFDQDIVKNGSWTVVSLRDCDKAQYSSVVDYEDMMMKECGRVYRRFLGVRSTRLIRIFVNDTMVIPIDPLMLNDESTSVLLDKIMIYRDRQDVEHEVHIKLVRLPDKESVEDEVISIDQVNQGFYIQRNGREIAAHETLEIFKRHNSYNRFRGEVDISGSLDSALGSNFMKRDINLRKDLQEQLDLAIRPGLALYSSKGKVERIDNKIKKESPNKEYEYLFLECRSDAIRYALGGLALFYARQNDQKCKFEDVAKFATWDGELAVKLRFSNDDILTEFTDTASMSIDSSQWFIVDNTVR